MANYYVNDRAQTNSNDHEVHVEGCGWLALANSVTYLGNYDSCRPAVTKAKTIYPDSNGCFFCSNECHTT